MSILAGYHPVIDVDATLNKYINDPVYKTEVLKILPKCLSKYPLTEKLVVYRGLSWDNQSGYNGFIESIKDGVLTTDRLTSWSPDYEVAYKFSTSRSEYINGENTSDDTVEDIKTELLGIVIKTIITPGSAIDIRKFSDKSESEVLVVPGKYKVEIVKSSQT